MNKEEIIYKYLYRTCNAQWRATITNDIRKIAKEEIEMPLSNSAVRLIAEWADTAIRNIAINAQKNAIARGSNSITAAHIFWMETNMQVEGYWPTHLDYVKKED